MYHTIYYKPSMIAALKEWEVIAAEAGVSKAALAYRWVVYHTELNGELGDGCIIGATTTEQWEETLRGIKRGCCPWRRWIRLTGFRRG
jgi:aflatoxin B1 aldehyde reductase